MKRKICLMMLITSVALHSYAQETKGSWNIQPKFGLNIATLTNDDDAKLKNMDLSIPIGVSYEFNNFQIDARYNWGMTKIVTGPDIDSTKNSVFQFTLGYKFKL